ncbi:clostripain-related cysteine peptidase [Bradyrhizobium sp. AZCC 2289]|uniref:clostripain-related cysteine peptidase n=1 Tax=Bradyrhizobium sp. AZCC 2289 TaxID=3117026 RepID=UPI002FEEFB8A
MSARHPRHKAVQGADGYFPLPARATGGAARSRRAAKRSSWLALLFLVLTAPIAVSAEPDRASAREWTVMIYMNGKNNLEQDALNNFHAMASVGGSDKVALAAELGRPSTPKGGDGNWAGVYRFLIDKDMAPQPRAAIEKVPAGAASDMGRPEVLSDFIRWAKGRYPAKRYMLIVWNHGQGYRLMLAMLAVRKATAVTGAVPTKIPIPTPGRGAIGGFRAVSSDQDTGSILYNADVQRAIAANFEGSDKLDVVGFDACLMSMMETAYALQRSSKVMIASEELEPGDGWQYAKWVSELVSSPTMSAADLGSKIVDSYRTHYGNSYYTTLSALDLSHIGEAASEMTKLSNMIRASGPSALSAMRSARRDLSSYAEWDDPPSYLSIDLMTLLQRFRSKTGSPQLQLQAEKVMGAIRSSILANYASTRSQGKLGDEFYGSQGLAIYYPRTLEDFHDDYFHTGYLKNNTDRPIEFVRNESWSDLLYALLGTK